MANGKEVSSPLFAVLPPALREPDKEARWEGEDETLTYTLLREPFSLEELIEYDCCMAFWRENKTMVYMSPCDCYARPDVDASQKCLILIYFETGPMLSIVGDTDDAVAETAAFFIDLEQPSEASEDATSLLIIRGGDFRAAGHECFTRIFDIGPTRKVQLGNLTLSAEQSRVLATQTDQIDVMFMKRTFQDEGTAFVKALQNRQSCFGCLSFDETTGLSEDNLQGLMQLDKLQYLSLPLLEDDKLALVPFSSQAKSLLYDITSAALLKADLTCFNIVTTRLSLDIHIDTDDYPTELMLSFWRHVAALGHFEHLRIAVQLNDEDAGSGILVPDCVVAEFMHAINANGNLELLTLCDPEGLGLKDHRGLHKFRAFVRNKELAFGRNYCHLRELLSHSRYITVTNDVGDVYTDGDAMDELCSLNAFYRGSADLAVAPPSNRPLLVATALMKSASSSFQHSALLLSDHVAALCELVQLAKLDELRGGARCPATWTKDAATPS